MRLLVVLASSFAVLSAATPARVALSELGLRVLADDGDRLVAEAADILPEAVEPYIEDPEARPHPGWTLARVSVTVELAPVLAVEARFERFGVPDEMLLIPPAWTPVRSNGWLEQLITRAVRNSALLPALPRVIAGPGFGAPPTDDPPFITDVPASADPGTGNQNETTLGIFADSLLCGGWNDNRTGVYHVGFARSTDAGATWSNPDTLMIDPGYAEDGDPVICVDDSGTIYYFWLSFDRSPQRGDVVLTKSTDWGRTWGPILNVTPGTPSSLDDKPWATIDGDDVYLTWYEYGTSFDLKFKRSTDRGQNWSAGVTVGSSGNGTFPFRGTGNDLYVGWGMSDIRLNKSTDLGATWSGQRTIISCPWSPGSTPWRMNNIPSFGTSRDRTRLYVVFADSRLQSNQTDVFFSRSTDAGQNWSTPVKVNDTQSGDGTHQFFPWLAVDPFDRIHVAWHDSRAGSNRVGQYYSYSDDSGATWAANVRVSDSAYQAGTFLGDYNACQADSNNVHVLWCDCRNGSSDPDVFFSRAAHIGRTVRDVGVMTILAPADTVDSGAVVVPLAVVRNWGTTDETFPVRLNIDPSWADSVIESLPAGLTDTVEFSEWTALSTGTFEIRCSTALAGDTNPANDLLADSVVVIPPAGIAGPQPNARLDLTGPTLAAGPAMVSYNLDRPSHVRLRVYGPDGRVRAVLADGFLPAGRHSAVLDQRRVGSGVMLVRMETPDADLTRKLIIGTH
ncbi:exo-alpha-sialidase [candidate division WOR-3 bacterium]|nr:exo-alpha-sialidase [candidate division WOR-3 bacterium]